MPLWMAPVGRELTVSGVTAEEAVRRHLERLGILKGARVSVLSQSGGNVIVRIREGRLALDRNLAGNIQVEEKKE